MKLFSKKKNKDNNIENKKTKKEKKGFFSFFKWKKKDKNIDNPSNEQKIFLDNNNYSNNLTDQTYLNNFNQNSNFSEDVLNEINTRNLVEEATRVSAFRNLESNLFVNDDSYFNETNNEVYYEQPKESPVEKFGVPFEIGFDNKEMIQKNLSYDTFYTEMDLKNFEMSEDDFVKFYKNGSTFYKLKKPHDNEDDFPIYSFFKKDTKFSDNESEEMKRQNFLDGLKNVTLFSKWDEDFEIKDILENNLNDSEKRSELKEKIFNLNREIEDKLERINKFNVESDDVGELIYTRKFIEQRQEEIKDKIYELKDDFANSNIFYKVKNLFFETYDEEDIYFGYKLEDISFDVYPKDRIVIVSDNSITNQLLVDVLKGDELKTSGYIYKNVLRKNQWVDTANLDYNYTTISNIDLNEELLYGLNSPDYLSFGIKNKKRDNVFMSMQRIFKSLEVSPEDKIREKLIQLMRFESQLDKKLVELDDLNLEKFFTICDILINKKMILIKSICQGMSFNEKMELLNFLNKYFALNNITAIYASDDLNDVNLFATKVMVIKEGQIMDFKSIDTILKQFNSVNEFVIHNLKYGNVRKIENK